jgi:RHS repeat-associated protein
MTRAESPRVTSARSTTARHPHLRRLLILVASACVAIQATPGAGKGIFSLLFPSSAAAATSDTHDLPPIPSAKRAARQLDIPKGDFRNLPPPKGAKSSTSAPVGGPVITETTPPTPIDYSKSTIESRTAQTDVYRNLDGTHTAVLHDYASNFQDASGHWQPINNDLTAADSTHHRNIGGPLGITFADDAGNSGLVNLVGKGWSVGFGVAGAATGTPGAVERNHERYTALAPGVDLDLLALDQGVKANLVLTQAPSGGAPHWSFPLRLSGVTANRKPDGTIVFTTATGATALTMPPGIAYDSSADPNSGNPAAAPVTAQLVGSGPSLGIDISVDSAWLASPDRIYPVTVDPTLNAGNDTTMSDAYASSACGTCNYNGGAQFDSGLQQYTDKIGYQVFSTNQDYTAIQWDLSPVSGKHILGAQLRSYFWQGSGEYDVWREGQSWNASGITWNTFPNHTADRAQITYGTTGTYVNVDLTSWASNWASGAWPSYGISMDTAGTNHYWVMAAAEDSSDLRPIFVVNYNTPPPASNPTAPTGNPTIMTSTPTLTTTAVSDADPGQTISYDFRIATGTDAETGAVFNSGWITNATYTVPAGFLQDGVTYYWKVWTYDGTDVTSSSPSGSFTVNLRLGDQPSSPVDTVGPVQVNLANGDLAYKTSSPTFQGVGGDIGLAYTYNSEAQPQFGLTGSYWSNCSMPSPSMPPSGQPVGQRTDTATSYAWNGGEPVPYAGTTNWCARWTGYITFPYAISATASNAWRIGADSDDGIKVTVGGQVVLNRWYDQSTLGTGQFTGATQFGTTVANQTLPITVDFYQHGGTSFLTLYVAGPVNCQLPVNWLSPTPPIMPQGWGLTGGDNRMLAYTSATVTPADLVLKSPDGSRHEYVQSSSGSGNANAWAPLSDDDSVVTQDSAGNFIVQGSDGIIYTFNSLGKLTSAVTPVDDAHPAAPRFSWNTSTARLDTITDPVTGRTAQLTYQTDPFASPPPSPACPTASGFDSDAPTGDLCLIRYSDGTQTNLYYLNGNLARVEDWWSSGNQSNTEITDFGYDANGRLAHLRSPLAADQVASGLRSDDDTVRTSVTYDGASRVASVTLPAPTSGSDPRPQHSYTYGTATQTDVHVAGLNEPNGYARRVTFDSAGHVLSDLDTAGLATTTTWDSGDRLLTKVAPSAVELARAYDGEHRLTDEYGPAPTGCFTGNLPNGSCTNPSVPHATTAYDEGIQGLAALYYANTMMPTGTPAAHATGTQDPTGAVNANWTSPPPGLTSTTNWAARFTGEILLPSTGTYTFWTDSDDGSRLFIDDQLVVDFWSDHAMNMSSAGTFNNSTANTRHRIRVDYYQDQGGAGLQLYWQPPGGTQAIVPGADLFPRYGLSTSQTDADGKKKATQYAAPELALPTAQITDPQGLNLNAATTYEAVGAGYLRVTQRMLPKGSVTAVTSSYYSSSDTAPANQCGGGVLAGLVKQEVGASPATGSPIQHQYVYDSRGRITGLQVVGDAHWTCTTYDTRGRVNSATDSQGHTTTFGYGTPGTVTMSYTDSGGTARTTQSTTDLNANAISYIDENGTRTTTTYDQAGRKTATFRQFSGQAASQLGAWTYDNFNRLVSQTDYSSGTSRVTTYAYDAAGRLSGETLPNGVVTTKTYDPSRGLVSALSHQSNGAELSPWSYAYSPGGRIVQETTTSRTRTFTYDGAGRLSQTVEGSATRNYSYDLDSNRCSMTTTCDNSYTYDSADRVLTSPSGSGYTYDAHGSVTAANLNESLDQAPMVSAAQPYDAPIGTTGGTVSSTVDWSPTPTYTSSAPGGNLGPGASIQYPFAADANNYLTSQVSWPQGTHTVSSSPSGTVGANGTASQSIPATSTGTISATINWQPTTAGGTTNTSVGAGGMSDTPVPVSASGTISATLTWPQATPDPVLQLTLLDPSGSIVATGSGTAGSNRQDLSFAVSGIAYPAHQTFTLRTTAVGIGSSYSLGWSSPVTANLDLALVNPSGATVATAGTTNKPEALSYTVPSGATGTYTLRVISRDYFAAYTGSASYPALGYAAMALTLSTGSGSVVASTTSSTGSASLTYTVASANTYTWVLRDTSSDLSASPYAFSWTATTEGTDTWAGSLTAAGSSSHVVTSAGKGNILSSMSWSPVNQSTSMSPSGSVGAVGTSSVSVSATGTGPLSANIDWSPTSYSRTISSSVAAAGTSDNPFQVSASGTISGTLTWPTATPNPVLTLELLDSSGNVLATGSTPTNNSTSLSYAVSGVTYPTHINYILRVLDVGGATGYTLSYAAPETASLNLKLFNPVGTLVAQTTGSAKPQSLSYSVPTGGSGTYTLQVVSLDYPASFSGTVSYPISVFADLTLNLLSPTNAVVATIRSASGGATLPVYLAPGSGTYTLQIVNNSGSVSVPSFTVTTQMPSIHTPNLVLTLKNASGTVITQDATTAKPKTISASVGAGQYTLEVTAGSGYAPAHLTATFPAHMAISYDANDHATQIQDSGQTTRNTLSPSGRVLRSLVTNALNGAVLEDTTYGYEDGSDSPAYSVPTGGNTVTTFVDGPDGLLLMDTNGAPTYPISDLHGDQVGTTDAGGTFTAGPVEDEFGLGNQPANHLGWLGDQQRMTVGGALGVVQMGVRLYSPALGRFLEVDPVPGGSANDYDYAYQEPVSGIDLDGRTYVTPYGCDLQPYGNYSGRKHRGNYHSPGFCANETGQNKQYDYSRVTMFDWSQTKRACGLGTGYGGWTQRGYEAWRHGAWHVVKGLARGARIACPVGFLIDLFRNAANNQNGARMW